MSALVSGVCRNARRCGRSAERAIAFGTERSCSLITRYSQVSGNAGRRADCYLTVEAWLATCFHSPPILTNVSVPITVRARCSPLSSESYVSLYVATAVLP